MRELRVFALRMGWICVTRRGGRRFYHLIIFRVRASQREMIFTGEMNNERARFCSLSSQSSPQSHSAIYFSRDNCRLERAAAHA
jgi:hypothetical protein